MRVTDVPLSARVTSMQNCGLNVNPARARTHLARRVAGGMGCHRPVAGLSGTGRFAGADVLRSERVDLPEVERSSALLLCIAERNFGDTPFEERSIPWGVRVGGATRSQAPLLRVWLRLGNAA